MSTLLLRIAAPLQAWGIASKFKYRDTQKEPSKSAIIGMVAAALGLERDHLRIQSLGQSLGFGLRVDREGKLLRDFHMATSLEHPYDTHRYYLCDAVFLVGLEGEDGLLSEIERALHCPWFPLFLGRRACPPEGRVCLGIRQGMSLMEALKAEPPLCASMPASLRVIADAAPGDPAAFMLRDQPISFDQRLRQHGLRPVAERYIRPDWAPIPDQHTVPTATEHDPFLGLEG